MKELHFPWIETAVLVPLMFAIVVRRLNCVITARSLTLGVAGVVFGLTLAAWQDFVTLGTRQADDGWHFMHLIFGAECFMIDQFSAPLLSLVSLVHAMTALTTLRTKLRRFSFAGNLVSLSIALATFSCKSPPVLVGFLILGWLPLLFELRSRGKSVQVYLIHMLAFSLLLIAGETLIWFEGGSRVHSMVGIVMLLCAVIIRAGFAPFHCWVTDVFEKGSFGSALTHTMPLVGAYAAVRLLLPVAPDWVLRSIGVLSLVTAVYAAGMATVQSEGRRFFAYLFISHSALVMVGLEMVTPIGLTGALCLWLSVCISLTGLGLTMRAVEARVGTLSMTSFRGLYEHTPSLAVLFLITGLASVGFPGTVGFIGTELLVDGAVATYPYVGAAVVIAAAINGIAIVQAYLLLFTGKQLSSTVSLATRFRERFAMLVLVSVMILGGFLPQPGVVSRYRAAHEILRDRASRIAGAEAPLPMNTSGDGHDESHGEEHDLGDDLEHDPQPGDHPVDGHVDGQVPEHSEVAPETDAKDAGQNHPDEHLPADTDATKSSDDEHQADPPSE